jgi:hypothetical protein
MVRFLWNTISTDLDDKNSFDRMMFQALSVTELLVKTSGDPVNWNASTVNSVGLAMSSNIINRDKTSAFVDLITTNYSYVKELFGISEDYYFEVYDLNSRVTVMRAPDVDVNTYDNVAAVSRLGLLNNSEVRIVFAMLR